MRLYEYIYKGTVMFSVYMPLNNAFLSVRRSVSFRDFEITKRVDRKYKVRVFSVSQCFPIGLLELRVAYEPVPL